MEESFDERVLIHFGSGLLTAAKDFSEVVLLNLWMQYWPILPAVSFSFPVSQIFKQIVLFSGYNCIVETTNAKPMTNFYESIAVNSEVLEFEFTEVHSPSSPKYFVNVFKESKLVCGFEMRQLHSSWDIVPPAPEWASGVQWQLGLAIEQNRSGTK